MVPQVEAGTCKVTLMSSGCVARVCDEMCRRPQYSGTGTSETMVPQVEAGTCKVTLMPSGCVARVCDEMCRRPQYSGTGTCQSDGTGDNGVSSRSWNMQSDVDAERLRRQSHGPRRTKLNTEDMEHVERNSEHFKSWGGSRHVSPERCRHHHRVLHVFPRPQSVEEESVQMCVFVYKRSWPWAGVLKAELGETGTPSLQSMVEQIREDTSNVNQIQYIKVPRDCVRGSEALAKMGRNMQRTTISQFL
ncbi:hypothetical protein QJS10_CPB12g01738 [Acorus calamus]|uniref:Uncharacterized protein n=1 Tax=Acorus calamus TaxID=4465 RepID=A0AAV9DK15_ACOCL|nr:hypothetical protein QJS10_CPB12g01738 [Acorus calamus]